MGNITEFFFNIIPGALLIFVLEYKSNFKILIVILGENPPQELYILLLIILSTFIGFLFQTATKWIKEKFLYQIIWMKIKNDEPYTFEQVEKFLRQKKKLINEKSFSQKKIERMFFFIDNYLSLNGGGRLLTHFASRLAYWSNLFWASLIIVVLALTNNINDISVSVAGFVLLGLSLYESLVHLKNHYDILLKSFAAYVLIEEK